MAGKWKLIAVSVFSTLALSGCITVAQPDGDSSSAAKPERTDADVIEFLDGYGSVASKCDGPNRVYVTTYDTGSAPSISVVPNDPRCDDSNDVVVPKEGEYYPKKNLVSAGG